jgi:hypothetical protein
LFAELQDVRWLMAEEEAEAVLVTISLDLPEIGVRGEAVVTGVEPCPVILPGPGKVVLTTFHHASSHLIDLYFSPQPTTGVNSQANTYLTSTSNSATHPLTTLQTSEEALLYPQASRSSSMDPSWERIGVTGNHPIWSEDRHDYIAAMDLRVGERLKNLSGDTVYVQQKLPRPGPTPVYNLEVQDEHVYYVGANGVLAHNVGKDCNERPSSSPIYSNWYEANLTKGPHYPGKGDNVHFREANTQLYTRMQSDPIFASALEHEHPGITSFLTPGPRGGMPDRTPAEFGLTWNHATGREGVLQLVPTSHHRAGGPVQASLHPHRGGGMKEWGGGRKRKRRQKE